MFNHVRKVFSTIRKHAKLASLVTMSAIPPLPGDFWEYLRKLIEILINWFQMVIGALFG